MFYIKSKKQIDTVSLIRIMKYKSSVRFNSYRPDFSFDCARVTQKQTFFAEWESRCVPALPYRASEE